MAKRIIGIILVIAALGTVLLGVKAGGSAPENQKIIESATVVSDGKVLPENEGKVVIVTGTLEAPLPFVDEKTGIPLNTIVANRHVEKLAIQQGTKEKPGDTWRWDYASLEEDFGGSKKLIAPGLTFGEFKVSDVLMQAVNVREPLKDYAYVDLKALGFDDTLEEGVVYLYDANCIMPLEGERVPEVDLFGKPDYTYRNLKGSCRVRYSVIPADADLRYTMIALQKNGILEDYEDLKMTDVIAGHLTVEELLEYADSSASTAKTTAFIIAAVLAGLGVLMIVRSTRPAAPAAKKKSKKRV